MKNTTLLKVLSATAIFSAVAAIEAYDQDSFAFAAEETPVVTNTTTSSTKPTTTQPAAPASTTGETNSPATPAVNSAATPATTSVTAPATTAPKAEEPATVAQDVKALKDGEYKITAEALKFYEEGQPSMAAAAIDNEKTKLIVKNGKYSVNVSFKPITFGGLRGYLGDLKYYDGDKTHENRKEIQKNEFKDSTIVENYSASETDNFVDTYKKEFPGRTVYPKTVNYNVDKNKIDSNNKLETYTEVFVPVMASISPAFGTQKMTLKFDLSSLARKKVTADNYEAATYENPNKDVEYKGTIKKDFPIHVQGHLRNANNNDEESLYGSALDNYVKVEKIGDKYKYTLRFKKGLADVGGEFYPFELHKVAYQGKDIPLTTLATNGNSSVKEGSIITDKLLEKIQLDGTAPYPNGALMSHFVTLKLYYETATAYKERPVKLEDVVAPAKPKPVKPTPTTPKEEPKPATPTAADHNVDADKVPNTFPTTVKAELNGRTTGTASIYENAFVKDVKVEKVGDKYQYTIQVKEGKSSNFLLRNKPFTVSKLTYKGAEINFTEVDAATKLKEGKILTDSLLDKIQVDAVLNVQTKGGAKPRFEDRTAESTIALDFPKVEKPKEVTPAKPSVPDHEVDADKVPSTFPATVKGELNGRTTNSSSIYENAFVKDVKVEKIGDKYQYTIQVKEGKSSTYLLRNKPFTVSKLTYKGNEVSFTEVDAATKLKEGKILTDSLLDKIQVDTVISVQTKGGAKPRFEERAAESTIALDFSTVEKAKEEAANNLVPARINNAHIADKPSMANDALVPEKTRVEKVNDAYHYYLTFKDLRFGTQVGTVDTLSVDNTAAERTDLGGEGHEKVFHFTSPEKLTEKTITFSVSVNGKPLRGHSNVAATLKFNWDGATPLATDQVTSLHKDETTKAQAEKERLEKEKAQKAEADRLEKEKLEKEAAAKAQAEKERLEKEKAQKAEADRLEKERLEKEAAAKAQAEKERLEKEAAAKAQVEKERLEKEKAQKAEADRLEKERLEKEAAAKAQAEKERLEKEKAQKAEADRLEKERLEKEAAAKAQAEKERLEKEKAQKAEADRLEKERLEKEAAAKAQAEKERLEKEKAQKAEADRLEKERLEKEAAAKAQAEKERLEKEKAQKAEADRLEKERLEKEAAAKAQAEKERLEKEKAQKAEADRLEKERLEREAAAKAQAEKERIEKEKAQKAEADRLEKERLEKEAAAKAQAEKERLEKEKAQKAEADRLEKERLEKEAAAKAQAEKERLEKEKAQKAEADRLEKERLEKEAAAKAQAEKERLEKEKAQKAEADRLEKERLEREAAAKAQAEKERLEKEKAQKAEADRLEKERLEREAAAKAQAEKERIEKEKAQKAEADRLEKERLEKEAAAKAQAEKERLEKEKAQKAEADRLEKERLEKEAAAKAQAEKERLEKEKAQKAEADRLEKERLEKEAAAKAQAEKERLEKEKAQKAEADRLEKERLEREAAAKAQAEKERIEKEKAQKAEADRLEKERLEKEAAAKAQAEKERLEKEKAQKAEADRLEKERLEKEAAAKAQAEKERLEKEKAQKAEADRLEKERLEKEAAAKAQAEKERLEKEKAQKAEADRLEKERLEREAAAKAQAEKERIEKEKAQKAEADRLEKERLEKEAAAKAQAEKEKAKLEELKKVALANIATDKDVNKEEASKLKEIVNSASLKDTLVAKVVENGSTEEITVSFDNTSLQADKFVIEKADKETVAKVEELVKKAEENLTVVKTIDLHFIDSKGTTINKQGETRAVTVAVVANEDEKLEVYYVNGNKLEKVPSVYKDGKLTFFTNHFSIYTIVKSKTVSSDQNTPVPITPAPSNKNEEIKSDKGEALVQEELPALDLNKVLNETTQKDSLNILGQTDNKKIKDNDNLDVVKTNNQVTSATPVNTVKKGLANTGLASTATAGLGALVLLSALVLRRKFNK